MSKRRGLLLDRDGIINIDHGYVGAREQFTFMPGLFPFLRVVEDRGYRLAILTNQSGVARGLYTEADYYMLTDWILATLQHEGIMIDLTLACFEHPEASITAYKRESYWRKPNLGMVLEAIQRLHLDPQRSAFLGDQPRDLQAAAAGGISHRLLMNGKETPLDGMVRVHDFNDVLTELTV